jgi:hypothetical protein
MREMRGGGGLRWDVRVEGRSREDYHIGKKTRR